jgi:hypothetical protein
MYLVLLLLVILHTSVGWRRWGRQYRFWLCIWKYRFPWSNPRRESGLLTHKLSGHISLLCIDVSQSTSQDAFENASLHQIIWKWSDFAPRIGIGWLSDDRQSRIIFQEEWKEVTPLLRYEKLGWKCDNHSKGQKEPSPITG